MLRNIFREISEIVSQETKSRGEDSKARIGHKFTTYSIIGLSPVVRQRQESTIS
jgi:hypothetical protein